MSSCIDTIMLIVSVIFLIMAAACMFALIYLIILGIRGTDPVIKDDDEEQAEYVRQYSKRKAEKRLEHAKWKEEKELELAMRKEEKERARAVSRKLRHRCVSESDYEPGTPGENPGARILPEKYPERVVFSGKDKESSEETLS